MASNVHHVQKKRWAIWNRNEQAMFNRLWYSLSPNSLKSIGVSRLNHRQLNTLRWNLCWTVADMMHEWRGEWGEAAVKERIKQKGMLCK